jgi:hypothetical protein
VVGFHLCGRFSLGPSNYLNTPRHVGVVIT